MKVNKNKNNSDLFYHFQDLYKFTRENPFGGFEEAILFDSWRTKSVKSDRKIAPSTLAFTVDN